MLAVLLRRSIFALFLSLVVFGCTSESKVSKDGRVRVFANDAQYKPDRGIAKLDISIPIERTKKNWTSSDVNFIEAGSRDYNYNFGGRFVVRKVFKISRGSNEDFVQSFGPIIADGKIFTINSRGVLRSFNERGENKKNWQVALNSLSQLRYFSKASFSYIASKDQRGILVAMNYGDLIMVNDISGKILWRVSYPGHTFLSAPIIANGKAYLLTAQNSILSIDLVDGSILFKTEGNIQNYVSYKSPMLNYADNTVLAGLSSGEVIAVDSIKGDKIWSYNLSGLVSSLGAGAELMDIDAAPIVNSSGLIFASSLSGKTAALAAGGNIIWQVDIKSDKSILPANNAVFVLDDDANLLCLESTSGRIKWVKSLGKYYEESTPRYLNDGSGVKLVKKNWGELTMIDGKILAFNDTEEMLEIDPNTGNIDTRHSIEKGMFGAAVVANERIYLKSRNGRMYVLY